MNRLEVKTSKLSFILAVLLGIIFVPLSLLSLINGVLYGIKIVPLGIGLMMLITFFGVLLLVRRGHSNSVKYFSDEGLMRNDGRSFAWTDLSRVVNQIRITSVAHGTKALWRTEVQFRNGDSAWLIPTKISNFGEVSDFVNSLPCEHTEVIA
jgi:hypothetical protein